MNKLSIINILGELHNILDLKKGYDKTLKNIPTVTENLQRIAYAFMKIAMII